MQACSQGARGKEARPAAAPLCPCPRFFAPTLPAVCEMGGEWGVRAMLGGPQEDGVGLSITAVAPGPSLHLGRAGGAPGSPASHHLPGAPGSLWPSWAHPAQCLVLSMLSIAP